MEDFDFSYLFYYGLGEKALGLGKFWGIGIATHMFLAGFAGGLYLTGYFLYLYRRKSPTLDLIWKFGIFSSGIVLLIDIFNLIYDHPNVLISVINPTLLRNFSSWIALGSWTILTFLIIWLVLLLDRFTRLKVSEGVRFALLSINVPIALVVLLYSGLMLRGSMFVPMWQSSALPVIFALNGAITGIAANLLYGIVKGKESESRLKAAVILLVALQIVFVAMFISDLSSLGTLPEFPKKAAGNVSLGPMESVAVKASWDFVLSGKYSTLFIYGSIILGMVFPLTLYGLSSIRKSLVADAISSISVLIGIYIFTIVILGAAAKALVFP